jgi:hypothetical protein
MTEVKQEKSTMTEVKQKYDRTETRKETMREVTNF